MPKPAEPNSSDPVGDTYEFEYQRHKVRIEQPGGARPRLKDGVQKARLFIDGEEIPVEVTERGVLSHEMAFKEYGTIDELAKDIIRQRGTAEIIKGHLGHDEHQPPENPERNRHPPKRKRGRN